MSYYTSMMLIVRNKYRIAHPGFSIFHSFMVNGPRRFQDDDSPENVKQLDAKSALGNCVGENQFARFEYLK